VAGSALAREGRLPNIGYHKGKLERKEKDGLSFRGSRRPIGPSENLYRAVICTTAKTGGKASGRKKKKIKNRGLF